MPLCLGLFRIKVMPEVDAPRLFDPSLYYERQIRPLELYYQAVGSVGSNNIRIVTEVLAKPDQILTEES